MKDEVSENTFISPIMFTNLAKVYFLVNVIKDKNSKK